MKNKIQHYVPASYLNAWSDPQTPMGQTPYVWVHKKDDFEGTPKAPKNIFWENDYYTFLTESGERDLFLEKYLAEIERQFVRVRHKIHEAEFTLSQEDMEALNIYVALMLNRTKRQGSNFLKSFKQLHEITVEMEKYHSAPPTTSLETAGLAKYGHHWMMAFGVDTIMSFLEKMSVAFVFSQPGSFFITSDDPCVLHDPKAYKKPPLFRSPGFSCPTVELTFPMSPTVLYLATWSDIEGVRNLQLDETTQFFNRRTRFACHEYFITHDGVTKNYWFDPGERPKDSWEDKKADEANKRRTL